ncbi:MAG: arsenosugar biosynthesis radical SAM protein ArsS [Candidatus Brocadiia bacterium]|nr:arsenosugar biosynthesis radical SAM protein ArsS [Candidatus Brocadiia bacterium]
MNRDFDRAICDVLGAPLTCRDVETLQVNVGFLCNQQCVHCHLRAGPERTEQMPEETADEVLRALERLGSPTLDITGGAPELNREFLRLVRGGREAGCRVIVRTNLTVLAGSERRAMAESLAEQQAAIVASMPCYMEENVERQRGRGVYGRSIEALQGLNSLGYGRDPALELDLVYNPAGAFMPPPQEGLEEDYREHLRGEHGIEFDALFAMANMPIGRFAEGLEGDGELEQYVDLLRRSFNPETVASLMCRHQVSVGFDGTLYDCDFNLALGLPASLDGRGRVRDLEPGTAVGRAIVTGEHCFGCTAGAGSSCKGVLAGEATSGNS